MPSLWEIKVMMGMTRNVVHRAVMVPNQAGQVPAGLGLHHAFCGQLPVEQHGLPPDFVQFGFHPDDIGPEVRADILDDARLGKLGQDEKEDDGPEGAADAVQEGEAEGVDFSTSHGPPGRR